MRRCPTVGIDDDLAAGQPGVTVRPANLEAAGRVDVIDGLVAEQIGGEDVGDDAFHISVELGLAVTLVIALGMLG